MSAQVSEAQGAWVERRSRALLDDGAMAEIGTPSGTMTLQFTDVEDRRGPWHRVEMASALERHDEVLRVAL